MTIEKMQDGTALTLCLSGRLDTATAPELETVLDSALPGTQDLTFILKAQKAMNDRGSVKLIHVNDTIMEVFDITGFVDILTIA